MGKVSFSKLELKLISAIVAISAVELLKAFLVSTKFTSEQIGWKIAIHLTFVFSGSLFAASDWISDRRKSVQARAALATQWGCMRCASVQACVNGHGHQR